MDGSSAPTGARKYCSERRVARSLLHLQEASRAPPLPPRKPSKKGFMGMSFSKSSAAGPSSAPVRRPPSPTEVSLLLTSLDLVLIQLRAQRRKAKASHLRTHHDPVTYKAASLELSPTIQLYTLVIPQYLYQYRHAVVTLDV